MISLQGLKNREDGQDMLEYGLLASLIALFTMAAVRLLANQITTVFWDDIVNRF